MLIISLQPFPKEKQAALGLCPKSLKQEGMRFTLVWCYSVLGQDPKLWDCLYGLGFLLTEDLFHDACWRYFF